MSPFLSLLHPFHLFLPLSSHALSPASPYSAPASVVTLFSPEISAFDIHSTPLLFCLSFLTSLPSLYLSPHPSPSLTPHIPQINSEYLPCVRHCEGCWGHWQAWFPVLGSRGVWRGIKSTHKQDTYTCQGMAGKRPRITGTHREGRDWDLAVSHLLCSDPGGGDGAPEPALGTRTTQR